jgi:hypothetical protein
MTGFYYECEVLIIGKPVTRLKIAKIPLKAFIFVSYFVVVFCR